MKKISAICTLLVLSVAVVSVFVNSTIIKPISANAKNFDELQPDPIDEQCAFFCESGQISGFCGFRVNADEDLRTTCYELATNPAYAKYYVQPCPTISCGPIWNEPWKRLIDFDGTPRGNAVGFSIGAKGYIGTAGGDQNEFWQYDTEQNIWTQKADFGGIARSGAVGFSIGQMGYVGTGNNGDLLDDFWEYDPIENSWTQKSDFGGGGRTGAIGFAIENKGYIGTGYDGSNSLKDFWEYDPQSDSWTRKADFGGIARYEAVGFAIDNEGYIGTGDDGFYSLKDFWEYDPQTNSWTQKADFGGVARSTAVGFSINGRGYIGSGTDPDFLSDDFWMYEPLTDTWTKIAEFAERPYAVGFSISNKGYIGTGFDGSTGLKDFWEYDPTKLYLNFSPDQLYLGGINSGDTSTPQNYQLTGQFLTDDVSISAPSGFEISLNEIDDYTSNLTVSPDEDGNVTSTIYVRFLPLHAMDYEGVIEHTSTGSQSHNVVVTGSGVDLEQNESWTPRAVFSDLASHGAVGFSINNKGYIGTGYDGSNYMKDFWEYDPQTNSWTQKADFGGSGRLRAVGFSIDNKGYIGTGYDGSRRDDFWEYDPEQNSWTQKADFGGAGKEWAVGFSIGNKGYIGTGRGTNHFDGDFWEYDPQSDSWTRKTDFGGTPRRQAVGFSIGDKGYIGGGDDGGSTKDFWEYNPETNSWSQIADFKGSYGTGFSIDDKGYIKLSGETDFWEYDQHSNTWNRKSDFDGDVSSPSFGFAIGNKGYIGTGDGEFWEYDSSVEPPNPPLLSHPENEAQNVSINPALSWQPVNRTDSYQLQISTDDSFSSVVMDNSGIEDTTYTVSSLDYEIQYFWRVRAENEFGASEWSEFWSFTTHEKAPWASKVDFGGTGRRYAVGFSIGDKGYIGTGFDGSYIKSFWEYDPSTNTWTQRADFGGTGRRYAVGFSIGNKGYIGTGNDGSYRKDFWEYDAESNIWTQRADFGGPPRKGALGFSIGNKGYIGTGWDGSNSRDFWEYDPSTNTWTQRADFGGSERRYAVGFSIENKGYIGTGSDDSGMRTDFWEYDAESNVWTQLADFGGTPRREAIGFSMGNKGYVGTGFDGSHTKDFWEYDPSSNTWIQRADFIGTARSSAVGFSIGDKGYLGTGNDGSYNKDFWEYDLSAEPPEIPLLSYPENGATDVYINPALYWHPAERTENYHLQVSTESNFSTIFAHESGIIDTTLIVDGFDYDTRYFWRVKAENVNGSSEWSDEWSFTTVIPPPEAPGLSSPPDSVVIVSSFMNFQWEPAERAEAYHLQVSLDENFERTRIDSSGIEGTKWQIELEGDTTYFWRVKAVNTGGESNWSDIRSYQLLEPRAPGKIVLSSPHNNADHQILALPFSWGKNIYAETYQFQIWKETEEQANVEGDQIIDSLVRDTTVADTLYHFSNLLPLDDYYWRVRGLRGGFEPGEWSDEWRLSTTYLADLNGDSRISAQDLSIFANAWKENDFAVGDIGPAAGVPPELQPLRDGVIDFEDLMVFAQMWNWSVDNQPPTSEMMLGKDQHSESNMELVIQTEEACGPHNNQLFSISLTGVEDVQTLALQFEYDEEFLQMDSLYYREDNDVIGLKHINNQQGVSLLHIASVDEVMDHRIANGDFIRIGLNASGKAEEMPLTITAKIYHSDASPGSAATKEFGLQNQVEQPSEFLLYQNYPNPFNPETLIRYEIPERTHVSLVIYDLTGRKIYTLVNKKQEKGYYKQFWNGVNQQGTPVASGLYLYHLRAGEYVKTKKMIFLK